MKYGLNLPNTGTWGDVSVFGELAQIAEDSGWDGVFLEDYIIWQRQQDMPAFDPWIILAAMAIRTRHIRLGTLVTPLTRRRPWKLVRETVSLDHLSGGRLILGVGLGDTGESVDADTSFTHFGEISDTRERAQMLDEALAVLSGLWTGEPFSYEGKHYQVKEVTLLPPPVQTPRIPIWIGGGFPLKGPMQRAAQWDGACPYRHGTHYMMPEDVEELRDYVLQKRGTLEDYDISVGGSPRHADWEQERDYIRSLAAVGATWWTEYIPPNSGATEEIRALIKRGPLRID